VEVREKVTVAPILSFSSGKTVKDLSVTAGAVEYNIGGTATQLGGQFNYSQRGPNFELWLAEHALRPNRWARMAEAFYSLNNFRFEETSTKWYRNRFGGEMEWKGPYRYGSPLRYELVTRSYREVALDVPSGGPPNGYYLGVIPELTWDQYHWHDLMPSGYRITVELKPGYFFGRTRSVMRDACSCCWPNPSPATPCSWSTESQKR
jgi:hypothetical protein